MLGHTLEGTFGDPHYGGNQDFIGWDLIGYPGLRLAVTAEQQRMDAAPSRSNLCLRPTQFDEHTTAGGAMASRLDPPTSWSSASAASGVWPSSR